MNPQPSLPANVIQLELCKQFQPPVIEACLLAGAKIGLPEIECQKFFHYYESNGWKVGRNRMRLWHSALAGWKLRWWQRQTEATRNVEIILRSNELKRVEERIKLLRGNYPDHMNWYDRDKQEYKSLKTRKGELLKILNLTV